MSVILSDYNSSTKSSVVAKNYMYSDLSLLFINHPQKNDIIPLTDIDAVKNSIKNLVLTSFYEKPFHPEIGSNIRGLLFEPGDYFTALLINDEIKKAITKYEPRVKNVNVDVVDYSYENAYNITISFEVLYDQKEVVEFYLNRLR